MRNTDAFGKIKNIHFIGIGGISMSGLAEVLWRGGFNVTGSDDFPSENTKRLTGLGIPVNIPNAAENIIASMEMAVFTAAVRTDNPEFIAAKNMGIPLVERAAFIGMLLKGYEYPVCVSGSHGKTTTTSLISEVCLGAGLDPTISIGGHMNRGGMNYRVGESPYFILEACEYNGSFLHWYPKIGVILNIDADHLDYFKNIGNIIEAFDGFAKNIRQDGALVIRTGIPGFDKITGGLSCKAVTFGLSGARFTPCDISYSAGLPSFTVKDGDKKTARINLKLLGEYNMLNALAAFAAATELGLPAETIASALSEARGTKRRFEYKGTYNQAPVYDDYAHHPTEISSCLAAARGLCGEETRIICLFQPHTYSRTKSLFDDFATAFSHADLIIILPIYAAREPFDAEISSEMLVERIKLSGRNAISMENFADTGKYLRDNACFGDLVLTMGAGDVHKIGEELLS